MPLYEKAFVAALSLTMFFLIIYGQIASHNTSSVEDVFFFPQKTIEITINGAVKKPGVYRVRMGTVLQEVLKKARLKRYADLKEVQCEETLEESQKIFIPHLQSLQIYLYGAVEKEGMIEVPLATRVCQLKKRVSFSKDADLACLSSRRYLRDQEQFFFPRKEKMKQSLEIK